MTPPNKAQDDDEGYAEHVATVSQWCMNCPECSDVPCAACLAYGVCDRMCRCRRDDDYDYDEGDDE